MPRNSSGVYTLPAGNPVVTGTTITSSWANPTMSDIANEVTNSLDRAGRGAMTGQLKAIDGTQAAPGITFGAELSSGWFRAGAGAVRLSLLNTIIAQYSSAGVALNAGTVAAPTISYIGDSNTGVYSPGADQIGLTAGGVQRVLANTIGVNLIVNSGVYGVRIADAAGTGDRIRILTGAAGNGAIIDVTDNGETTTARPLNIGASNGTVNLGSGNQFTKDASGNIGIGGAPVERLHVWGSSGTGIISDRNAILAATNNAGGLELRGGSSASANASLIYGRLLSEVVSSTAGAQSGSFVLQLASAGSLTERFRMTSAGDASIPGRLAVGGSAPFFGGAPLNARVGTNQNMAVLSVTSGGTPMVAVSGLTDAGVSTNLLIAGNTLRLSGNGGSTEHLTIANNGQAAFFSTQAKRQIFTAGPTGSNGATYDFENWNNSSNPVAMGRLYCQTTSGAVGNEAADLLFYTKPSSGALAETFRLKDVGQIFVPRIHNNASGAGGTTPMIASGTYTPTGTTGANCSGVGPSPAQWVRVGNVVTVYGSTTAAPVGIGVMTFSLSLPITSNLTVQTDLNGVYVTTDAGALNRGITGDTVNDRAFFDITLSATGNRTYMYCFSYEVK